MADQISDAILDQFLAYDQHARVACETFVTTGQVVLMGEVSSEAYIDLQTVARKTINKIGYTKAEYHLTATHAVSSALSMSRAKTSIAVWIVKSRKNREQATKA